MVIIMYYAGFTIICEGVAQFPTLEAMQEWLSHETDIDRFLDVDGKRWDAHMGERVEFSPAQVSEMFGGSVENALYQQEEPATPGIMWAYF